MTARVRRQPVSGLLIWPVFVMLSACAGLGPRTGTDVAPLERQILLTVEQNDFAAIGLTGPPDTRYLRRRGYGDAPPAVERVLDQLANEHGIERKEGWPIRSLDVYCEVFVVPEGADVDVMIERLLADPRVDLAQPMNVFEALARRYDDPLADLQSGALALGVEQAHRLATGKGVLVAVIDSAVDAAHPDLKGRVNIARDLVEPRRKSTSGEVHGTAVAGVIASAIDNKEGIIGVAPDVGIASLRACWPHPAEAGGARCSSFTLAQALEVAIALEPGIINLSVAGPADPLLARLLDAAIARGIVVVAAEPEASSDASFPASHPSVIVARSSSGPAEGPSSYRLPAPADEILSTTPGAGYAFFSGTSLAAAHVSGVIALLLERAPSIGARRIAEVLTHTSVHDGDSVSVNACYALEEVMDVRACGPRLETAGF